MKALFQVPKVSRPSARKNAKKQASTLRKPKRSDKD